MRRRLAVLECGFSLFSVSGNVDTGVSLITFKALRGRRSSSKMRLFAVSLSGLNTECKPANFFNSRRVGCQTVLCLFLLYFPHGMRSQGSAECTIQVLRGRRNSGKLRLLADLSLSGRVE